MKKYIKKYIKTIFSLSFILLVTGVVYFVFKDSWPDIVAQLKNASPVYIAVLFILGNMFYIFDGLAYWYTIKRCGDYCSIWDCIKMAYMGVFFNVTTAGAGTKASQIVYMAKKRSIDPGRSFGILVMEYVSHKIAIVLCALLSITVFSGVFDYRLSQIRPYFYAGFAFSMVIVSFLVWICVSRRVHSVIIAPCRRFIKKESWLRKIDALEDQLKKLQSVSIDFSRDIHGVIRLTVLNVIKVMFWYSMPYAAYAAVTGTTPSMGFFSCLVTASMTQLLIGVLPGLGGTGSTEVAYTFIFGSIFHESVTASTMILYRCFNYYVPFIISIIVMLAIGNSKNRKV